jgi:hypothetical protein
MRKNISTTGSKCSTFFRTDLILVFSTISICNYAPPPYIAILCENYEEKHIANVFVIKYVQFVDDEMLISIFL